MKYTQLGRSGPVVSRIRLGCMTYGTPKWRPWVLDEINSRAFFRKAIDLGISFFDTADIYSLGVREESRAALSGRWRTCSDDEQRPS